MNPRLTAVWIPNIETIQVLVNLTEEGASYQSRAVSPLRKNARLRFDPRRSMPAVLETSELLREGFWLDSLCELALIADAFPKAGFAYPPSPDLTMKAAPMHDKDEAAGIDRLNRYVDWIAKFSQVADVPAFLNSNGDDYRSAVEELEKALGPSAASIPAELEQYFGEGYRSYLSVVSFLLPAGFTFGIPVSTPDGPLAFQVLAPFIEPDESLTWSSPDQALAATERELARVFIKSVIARGVLAARPFFDAFERHRDKLGMLGHEEPLSCLEDHLVQAVHARILARRGQMKASEALVQYDEEAGYIFSKQFVTGLKEYESHRREFSDFESFFPTLMDSFSES